MENNHASKGLGSPHFWLLVLYAGVYFLEYLSNSVIKLLERFLKLYKKTCIQCLTLLLP